MNARDVPAVSPSVKASPCLWLLAVLSLILSGCSTAQRHYQADVRRPVQPWEGTSSRWGGYVDFVEEGERQVVFTTYNFPALDFARYFAHVRAAEVTLQGGEQYFRVVDMREQVIPEESFFPAYTTPGYWERDEYTVVEKDSDGNEVCRTIVEREYVPPVHHPERWVTNQVYRFQLAFVFTDQEGEDAAAFLRHVLQEGTPWGTPKLEEATMELLKERDATLVRASLRSREGEDPA